MLARGKPLPDPGV